MMQISPYLTFTGNCREAMTFYFVTEGIHAALERAFSSAKGKDVRLEGGVSTIQQYLEAKLIDEMHIAITPVLLTRIFRRKYRL